MFSYCSCGCDVNVCGYIEQAHTDLSALIIITSDDNEIKYSYLALHGSCTLIFTLQPKMFYFIFLISITDF